MDSWDITLLIVAGYLAVTALVRLMIRRRNQLIDHLRRELEQEKKRKKKKAA